MKNRRRMETLNESAMSVALTDIQQEMSNKKLQNSSMLTFNFRIKMANFVRNLVISYNQVCNENQLKLQRELDETRDEFRKFRSQQTEIIALKDNTMDQQRIDVTRTINKQQHEMTRTMEKLWETSRKCQEQQTVIDNNSAEIAVFKKEEMILESSQKSLQEQLTQQFLAIEKLQTENSSLHTVINSGCFSETSKPKIMNDFDTSCSSGDSGVPRIIPNEVLQEILNEELEEPFECIICFEFKDDNNQTDPSKSTYQLNCCSQYLCGACFTNLENTSLFNVNKTVKCPHCRNDKSTVSKFSRIKDTINCMRENTAKKVTYAKARRLNFSDVRRPDSTDSESSGGPESISWCFQM